MSRAAPAPPREDDARLAPYRMLRDGRALAAHGLLVAESRHVVRRLVTSGRFRVRSLLLTPRAAEALADLRARLPEDVAWCVAEDAVVAELAGHRVHQGCLALAEREPARDPAALVRAAARGRGRLLALERLADPQNVGAVFRNAHAFGVDAVLLVDGGADPLYRQAIRVSMGATLEVPFAACRGAEAWAALGAAGFERLALCADAGEDLRHVARRGRGAAGDMRARRVALLLGSEGCGLSAAARAAADRRVRIVTAPGCDSLNVATAAAIALHGLADDAPRAEEGPPCGC